MSGRKIPCCTGDLNPGCYCTWLFKWMLYQLSYLCPKVLIQMWMNEIEWETEREGEGMWCSQFVHLNNLHLYYCLLWLSCCAAGVCTSGSPTMVSRCPSLPSWMTWRTWALSKSWRVIWGGLLRCMSVSLLLYIFMGDLRWSGECYGVCHGQFYSISMVTWGGVGSVKVYVIDSVALSSWMTWGGVESIEMNVNIAPSSWMTWGGVECWGAYQC